MRKRRAHPRNHVNRGSTRHDLGHLLQEDIGVIQAELLDPFLHYRRKSELFIGHASSTGTSGSASVFGRQSC